MISSRYILNPKHNNMAPLKKNASADHLRAHE